MTLISELAGEFPSSYALVTLFSCFRFMLSCKITYFKENVVQEVITESIWQQKKNILKEVM